MNVTVEKIEKLFNEAMGWGMVMGRELGSDSLGAWGFERERKLKVLMRQFLKILEEDGGQTTAEELGGVINFGPYSDDAIVVLADDYRSLHHAFTTMVAINREPCQFHANDSSACETYSGHVPCLSETGPKAIRRAMLNAQAMCPHSVTGTPDRAEWIGTHFLKYLNGEV